MNLKTRFLNLFRRISRIPSIESKLAESIINGSKFSKKLIAGNQLYPKGSFRNCTRNNINYRVDISDYMEHAIYFGISDGGDFDRRVLYSLIKEDFVCFDVGANIGETTFNFSRLAPRGMIYSFEPVPFLFERLKTNFNLNHFHNISLQKLAVSDKKEELFFEIPDNKNSAGISLNKEKSSKSDVVYSITIDEFVRQHNIPTVDFIKIDVEGFENFVINGGVSTLIKFHPILFIEIDNKNLNKNETSEKQLLTQLQDKLGYVLYKVDGNRTIKITSIQDTNEHYDVLCIFEMN